MKSGRMAKVASFGLAFACSLAMVPAVQGAMVVTVPNGEFTSTTATTIPQTGSSTGYSVNIPTGWTVTTDPDAPYTGVETAPNASGNAWYYIGGNWNGSEGFATLEQTNTAAIHAVGDTYTMSFSGIVQQFGATDPTAIPATLTAQLLVDGTAVQTKDISFTSASPTPSFDPYSLTWTADRTGELGILFHIQAGSGYNAYTHIGHVGLSYSAVPEPGAIVLLSLGMVSLLAYAWRKRK